MPEDKIKKIKRKKKKKMITVEEEEARKVCDAREILCLVSDMQERSQKSVWCAT